MGVTPGGADPQPVAVGVPQLDLPGPRHLLGGDTELGRDRVHIADPQIHQGAGGRIAPVLRQEEPHRAPGHLHEGGEVRLEAVLPLLDEAQAGVPRHRRGGVLDAQDGNGLLDHALGGARLGRVVRCGVDHGITVTGGCDNPAARRRAARPQPWQAVRRPERCAERCAGAVCPDGAGVSARVPVCRAAAHVLADRGRLRCFRAGPAPERSGRGSGGGHGGRGG